MHHKHESRKKNFKDSIGSVIKSQHGKGKKSVCVGCQLNCMIARNADTKHWANLEKIDPKYDGTTLCPKQEKPVIKIRGRTK